MGKMRALAVVWVLCVVRLAYADDLQQAEDLFRAGRTLREQGKTIEACELFHKALAFNPNAIGLILNVALCAEEAGKLATATRLFSDARDRAREQSLDPQRETAEQHVATLAARLPHLAIQFTERPSGTKLVVDDRVIAGTTDDLLVDPGNVKVVVSAPGRVTYEVEVKLVEGKHEAIVIPALGAPVTIVKTTTTTTPARHAVGKVMLAAGVLTFASAQIIALVARSRWIDATTALDQAGVPYCNGVSGTLVCDTPHYTKAQSAKTLGNVGTGVGVVGIALASAGLALWLVPDRGERSVAVVPMVNDDVGIAAVGHF